MLAPLCGLCDYCTNLYFFNRSLKIGKIYLSHGSSGVLSHVYCLTCPAPCLLSHVFCLTSPVSCLLSHISSLRSPVSHLLSHVPCLRCAAMCPTILNCLATVCFYLLKIFIVLNYTGNSQVFFSSKKLFFMRLLCNYLVRKLRGNGAIQRHLLFAPLPPRHYFLN